MGAGTRISKYCSKYTNARPQKTHPPHSTGSHHGRDARSLFFKRGFSAHRTHVVQGSVCVFKTTPCAKTCPLPTNQSAPEENKSGTREAQKLTKHDYAVGPLSCR